MNIRTFSFLTTLVVAAAIDIPNAFAQWSTFKGGATRNIAIHRAFSTDTTLLWHHRIPSTVTASPVVAGSTLFVASDLGVLYAFDLIRRNLLWAVDTGGAVRSTPAAGDLYLYVLTESGSMMALELDSGRIVWTFETQGEHRFSAYGYLGITHESAIEDPWDLLSSSPLLSDDLVIFGSADQHLYALDRETGQRVWSYKTGGIIHSSPARWQDLVIVGSWDSHVYALDIETGNLAWSFATESEQKFNVWHGIQASPAVFDDTVYIGSRDGYLYALGAATGDVSWRYDMARSWVVPTVSIDENTVYVGSSDTGLLKAVERETGHELWRHPTGGWTYSSPLLFNDAVLVSTMLGRVLAVDKASGEAIWYQDFGALQTDIYRILNDEHKLNVDHNDTWYDSLYGMMARVLASGGFMASPAWYNGQFILISTAGDIYLFGD